MYPKAPPAYVGAFSVVPIWEACPTIISVVSVFIRELFASLSIYPTNPPAAVGAVTDIFLYDEFSIWLPIDAALESGSSKRTIPVAAIFLFVLTVFLALPNSPPAFCGP